MAVETQAPATVRPMTGDEYIESLRDGREIYIYGERVKDVTDAPGVPQPARMVARLYDALHDPENARRPDRARPTPATAASRIRSSGPRSTVEDLVADRDAIAAWARHDLRLDGPLPRLQGLVPRHAGRQRRVLRAVPGQRASAGTRAPRRRSCTATTRSSTRRSTATCRPTRSRDVFVHVEKETDAGLDRLRRQGRRHRLGDHQLQLHRPLRRCRSRRRSSR